METSAVNFFPEKVSIKKRKYKEKSVETSFTKHLIIVLINFTGLVGRNLIIKLSYYTKLFMIFRMNVWEECKRGAVLQVDMNLVWI
jgi:hypothetical protein